MNALSSSDLKKTLDTLYATRSLQHLANDPLSFCHRFSAPEDREIAALIASSFAYGNVKIILRSLEAIFDRVGPSPRRFVEQFEPQQGGRLFAGFKHRFNDARDLCALLYAARLMLDTAGSLEGFFLRGYAAEDADVGAALAGYAATVLAFDYTPVFGTPAPPDSSYFPFFFPSPLAGSACKRLCMYLRWLVRPDDGIDLGLWQGVSPAKLIIPVDAHIQKICRLLGFTARKQADWKMAQEITAVLRRFEPLDPVKYDFSICHLGISEGCSGTSSAQCAVCAVKGICSGTG